MIAKPEPETHSDAIETAVREVLDTWFNTYNAGEIDLCPATYTDDATILFSDGPPTQGRDAIHRLHREWRAAEPGMEKSYELLECGGGGEWAFCLNTFRGWSTLPGRSEEIRTGIVHNVLRRQPDGSLRFYITSMHMTEPE